jgi:hypothetical protein
MSLVAFVSGRSPGLTTGLHAIAAMWPVPGHAILAELDAAGGSLVARHDLAPEPGLTELAVAGRRGLDPATVLRHCRRLPSGAVALVSPVNPEQVVSALTVLGPDLGWALDAVEDAAVLADCGRIDRRSPAMDVVHAAPHVVVVVTPTLEGVAYAHARMEMLASVPGRLALITIGDRPYRPDEVGVALGLPVVGSLTHDPAGAIRLNSGRSTRRNELCRSAAVIARQLAGMLAPVKVAPTPTPTPTPTAGDGHGRGQGPRPATHEPRHLPPLPPGVPDPEGAISSQRSRR